MKIGYIRVSTQEQNTMRQEVLMESLSMESKAATGRDELAVLICRNFESIL